MKSRLLFLLSLVMISTGLFGQVTSVGIIGTASPSGNWDTETPMNQVDDSTWTIDIALFTGDAKFRANNAWDINWGSADFPSGIGTQNGANIPVVAGNYTVTFNSNSGAYFFDVDSDISIIGSATAGGWVNDTKMYEVEGDTSKYFIVADLVQGEMKFRTTGSWDRNWGSLDFPAGTGTQNGPNIPIAQAGTYEIRFDSLSGEYSFTEVVEFESIGIIGDATLGGWNLETPLTKSQTNPDLWRGVLNLTDGGAKFRANNSWDVNWGGTDFPSGVGVLGTSDNIPVTAGEYIITFNTSTFEYNFVEVVDYEYIELIGSGTPGGWLTGTLMDKDENDKTIWKMRITLTDGEVKFRADPDYIVNWGGGDFPEGIGEQDGPNIPVTAGDYFVDFNSATGAYKFTIVVEYDSISLVGRSGPFGDWPGDDNSRDTYLNKDAVDFNLWTHPSVALSNHEDFPVDGGVKFRANSAWTVNWGSADFPSGIGVLNGPNIQTTAGNFSVVFRSDTGEYAFTPVSSTHNLLDNRVLHIYPNPAKDFVFIEVQDDAMSGEVKVNILNTTGQLMTSQVVNLDGNVNIPVHNLNAGSYIIKISNEKNLVSRNLIIVK